jgi:hypothetical protein
MLSWMASSTSLAIAVATLLMAVLANGHSSLLYPPSRNSIDHALPPWKNGSWGDGTYGPDAWGCNCINSTTEGGQVACNAGQSCFYFSNGCSIGCPTCDGGDSKHGGANPNLKDRCGSGVGPKTFILLRVLSFLLRLRVCLPDCV